ncbi:MAG TPA: hypothetical protein PKW79_07040 [Rhabdochlamydiaceae bacterium]|nr:hypothetical protein [Rhabdochlamydiaceae bacterium]
MRCEAAEFNDIEWNVRETEKVGHWNGKSVQSLGADQVIHQIYASSRVESSVHLRPIIGDYTPDENSVSSHSDNNSSSSSESEARGGYDLGGYHEKDRNGSRSGIKGGVNYGTESVEGYVQGNVEKDKNGNMSGRVEGGIRGKF